MNDLQDKSVLVLGLGASGLAMAVWCSLAGARVTVADTRAEPPQLAALRLAVPTATFLHCEMSESLLSVADFDLIVKSPGISPASVAALRSAAKTSAIEFGNELSLFSQALAGLKESRGYSPRIIGITGTNGKTTVTSLTTQLVERCGVSVAMAGNIGPTLLETLAQRLEEDALPEIWVLELSSFQLDGVSNFSPTVATVLNITQDHLDWHGDLAAYAAAKERIYGQGIMLLNRDDARVMSALPALVKGKQLRNYGTFGADEPRRPGDFGLERVGGMTWLVRAMQADETVKRKKDEEITLHIQRLMPVEALRIRGVHNATNALAALALATATGCPLAPMLYGLREYRGEPHRVESVAVIEGIEYFDDSKGTNVGATVAALAGLGGAGEGRKLVLIAGGDGKGQNFSPLAEPVVRYARAVVLIGRDAARIRAVLQSGVVPLFDAPSLPEAVRLASRQASAGDAVLLSPACASLDMFDNYRHRADVFCESVRALALESGVVA
jgi:UDP-N-acetylmuramoylalanine--D-glutamate ligase